MNIKAGHAEEMEHGEGEGFVPGYLLYLLATASDVASDHFHEQIRERGVRVPEWRILACLADHDGRMVTQLAQLALMEQSRMTKIIDQMVLRKLVTRRNDRRDRRRVRVFLTEQGRRLAEELVAEARAHETMLTDPLPPGEAALLKDTLKRIKALHDPAQGRGARAGMAGAANDAAADLPGN